MVVLFYFVLGGELYTCGGRGLEKIAESTPANILAKCPLYPKMADGFLWYIVDLSCVSRTAEDILKTAALA